MMNKDSLKARANNLSKELNIPQNVVYNRFFFDAFLSRLAASKYAHKFILKGGLFLSSLLGVDTRTTMDIDFYLNKLSLEQEQIVQIFDEIIHAKSNDGISFKITDVSSIRLEDRYGGFQIAILGKFDNIKYQFRIDLATGDPIVPSEHPYNYQCLVTGDVLPLYTYSLESIIAEKLETVLSRGIVNSRAKDFYDLYIMRMTQLKNVHPEVLRVAFNKTCRYRNTTISKEGALELINTIRSNDQIQHRWARYTKSTLFAKDLAFDDVINAILNWIDDIFIVIKNS